MGLICATNAQFLWSRGSAVYQQSRFYEEQNFSLSSYGGDPKNRGRILAEIIEEIRRKAPRLHVTMKINCSDFLRGGLVPQESLAICRLCEEAGLDSIEVSGNGTSVSGIKPGVNKAYFGAFALALAEKISTLALQNGVDIKTVSGMLGHYDAGFTLRTYTHATDRMQEQAAATMGALISASFAL